MLCYCQILSPLILLSSLPTMPDFTALSNSVPNCSSRWLPRFARDSLCCPVCATTCVTNKHSCTYKYSPHSSGTSSFLVQTVLVWEGETPSSPPPKQVVTNVCSSSSPPPSLRSAFQASTPFSRRMGEGFFPRPHLYTAASRLDNGKQVASLRTSGACLLFRSPPCVPPSCPSFLRTFGRDTWGVVRLCVFVCCSPKRSEA